MNEAVITFLASFLIYILFLGLAVLWIIDGKIKKEQVIHAIAAVGISYLLSEVIKMLFPTIRPFIQNGTEVLTLTVPMDGAFPSSHTAAAFALGVTIFMHDKKYGWIYLLLAVVIGTARVLANVHYPADILGGALIGMLTAIVIEKSHFPLTLSRR